MFGHNNFPFYVSTPFTSQHQINSSLQITISRVTHAKYVACSTHCSVSLKLLYVVSNLHRLSIEYLYLSMMYLFSIVSIYFILGSFVYSGETRCQEVAYSSLDCLNLLSLQVSFLFVLGRHFLSCCLSFTRNRLVSSVR